ncbi:MAG: cytochrome b/b6 domain-containing protein [Acidimicrobiales bacterium]
MTVGDAHVSTLELLRFDRVQRAAHWTNALLFFALMATAIPLYFGSLFGVVLARHDVEMVHLWCGVTLVVPLAVSLVGPWGRAMRRDLRRVNYWTRDEITWLRSLGATTLRADKFNPGQKLNTIFIGATILVMLVSGAMLQWFRFFPVSWRTGATFVHDVFSLAIFVVVAAHVLLALANPPALRAMVKGTISEKWAAQHAPKWLDEVNQFDETKGVD